MIALFLGLLAAGIAVGAGVALGRWVTEPVRRLPK